MRITLDENQLALDEPARAMDGQAVHFFDSVREYRNAALMMTAVWILLPGLAIVLALWSCSTVGCADDPDERIWLYVVVPVAMFTIPVWLLWLRKRSKPPVTRLVIGTEGIFLPMRMDGPIAWSAISRIAMREHRHRGARTNVTLSIHPADPAGIGRRGSGALRTMERWLHGTDLNVGLELLVGEPEDVLAALVEFAPASLTSGLVLEG